MRIPKLNRPSTLAGLLATVGLSVFSATSFADGGQAVILNTATLLLHESPNGPSDRPVSRCSGAGVMDSTLAYEPTSGDILAVWTNSAKTRNNDNSAMQGAIAVANLSASGLTTKIPTIELPQLEGERPFMRPNAAIGKNFMMAIFASEDNGINNGNPQSVAWVFDRTGKIIPISNTNRGDPMKPINLVSLRNGQQDGQQRGPHSICALGTEADGSESWLLGEQKNNQSAWVFKVNVKSDGTTAKVTVPFSVKVLNDARHNRPQIACPPGPQGLSGKQYAVVTSVEANNQPADIGVRAILVDTSTGKVMASKLIAASNPNQRIYAVQPSAVYISDQVVGIQWQLAQAQRKNNQGHSNSGGQLSKLTTLRVSTGADAFDKLDEVERVAPFQRHSEAYGAAFGPDGTVPAAAVIAGSPTGTSKGMVQHILIDPASGKIGTVNTQTGAKVVTDPMSLFEVAKFTDVANLPARAKRNPNDQGRGFIKGISGLANPGFGQANGFMPEVKTFALSAVAGLKDPMTSNRDSLFISLIPESWNGSIKIFPGAAVDAANIKLGPSPTTSVPQDDGSGNDPFGSGSTGDPSVGTGGHYGPHAVPADAGCSVGAVGTGGGAGGLALLGLGLAFAAARRRKES